MDLASFPGRFLKSWRGGRGGGGGGGVWYRNGNVLASKVEPVLFTPPASVGPSAYLSHCRTP